MDTRLVVVGFTTVLSVCETVYTSLEKPEMKSFRIYMMMSNWIDREKVQSQFSRSGRGQQSHKKSY
jgi:hypothetical protein